MPKLSKGTGSGHHAYDAFDSCPRRYYLAYELGYESKMGSVAASTGTVMHAWLHAFHEKGTAAAANKAAAMTIVQLGKRYENLALAEARDEITKQVGLFAQHYPVWIAKWQREKGELNFKQFEVESTSTVRHGDMSAPYTTRRDGLVHWADSLWVWEIKTSGFPTSRLLRMQRMDGQITGYVHDAQFHGSDCSGGLLLHCHTGVKDPDKLFALQPMLRPPDLIANWRRAIVHTCRQIEEARKEADKDEAYPQHFNRCVEQMKECPFPDVCAAATLKEGVEVLEAFFRKKEE